MATREKNSVLYMNVVPAVVIGVGALGAALTFLALMLSQSQAAGVASREPARISAGLGIAVPEVHYQDGQIIAEVRNPGEWHDIRDFVQPANPNVVRMVREMSYG